jgi:hypothetical protein
VGSSFYFFFKFTIPVLEEKKIKILNGQFGSRTKNHNPPKTGTSQHWYKASLTSHLFSYPPTYI